MTTYVLRGGGDGAQRLRLLDRVKWPTTRALLRRAGLRRGMTCLDAGCGGGAVTLRLARRVGADGWVEGIDVDERALALAREEAKRRQLPAEFRNLGADELADESRWDLVFARFLLSHLPDPARALAQLVRAAKPGGVVVLEDVDFPGHFCYPSSQAFMRYVELYQEVVRRRGSDPAIGPRMLGLCQDAGLADVGLEVVLPTFHMGEGKRLAAVTMEHIRESVLTAGLATAAEIDDLVAALAADAADPTTVQSLPRIFQVWGRRPAP